MNGRFFQEARLIYAKKLFPLPPAVYSGGSDYENMLIQVADAVGPMVVQIRTEKIISRTAPLNRPCLH